MTREEACNLAARALVPLPQDDSDRRMSDAEYAKAERDAEVAHVGFAHSPVPTIFLTSQDFIEGCLPDDDETEKDYEATTYEKTGRDDDETDDQDDSDEDRCRGCGRTVEGCAGECEMCFPTERGI